jgi:hypothetical protein
MTPARRAAGRRRRAIANARPFRAGVVALILACLATRTQAQILYGVPPPAGSPSPLWTAPPLAIAGPYGSTVRLELFERMRGEFVDWFATPANGPRPNFRYNFLGNKFQLGVRVTRDPYELFVQFQDSTLANIPDNGVGVGATYYANTPEAVQNGAILRQGWIGARRAFQLPLGVRAGRLLYSDGLDAPATEPELKWIQVNRLSQRLIGPFDYTHVGRSFDGGMLSYDAAPVNVTGFGFVPTFGGYDVDANPELAITLGGLALNLEDGPATGPTLGRLFWYYYGDDRDVLYVDNRPLAARQSAIGQHSHIHTIGAHLVRLERIGPGTADAMAFGFGQFGSYQNLAQRAWAYGVEAGYRLADIWAQPWLRGGINSGSGDGDPNDGTHGTFFQLLPTAWLYAQFPFYNMMNNQDVFAQAVLDPHPMVSLRVDGHWLRLNSGRDLDYAGGGATNNSLFGYTGVSGNGRLELAYLLHLMLTVRPTAFLTCNGFYAHAWGQGVINQAYAGRDGNYGFFEAILAF